ncbi:Origin recognition complex subunit 2 [Pseudocyphellaria aurata]|nr:Origin recognition complex subunit 2 [Pseudocyphellaria aurata]
MARTKKRQEVDEGAAQGRTTLRVHRPLRGGNLDREEQAEIDGSSHDAETPTKRKRGRPPKSINRPKAIHNEFGEQFDQEEQDEIDGSSHDAETPTKRKRGRPPKSINRPKAIHNEFAEQLDQNSPISNPKGKALFTTPTKNRGKRGEDSAEHMGPVVSNADRSARRKSARALIQRTVIDDLSDEDDPHEENALAKSIWDVESSEDNDGPQEENGEDDRAEEPISTPSKRTSKQGPKTRRKRTPTPPQDLPPHELYFFQNRAGNTKTSNNTLSSLSLLSHEQYYQQMKTYKDPHTSCFKFLHSLHSRSFPQWNFELSQSFNICLYGYGSKRHLVTSFANHVHSLYQPTPPKIIVINSYIPNLTIRQILSTVAGVVFDSPPSSIPTKLGTQPRAIVTSILTHITTSPPLSPIHIFINSLDAPPLRRAPIPSLLALLAASPHIRVLATCDTPTFPLLWDASTREQYNFLFHDTTTYESYAPVEVGSVIDDVNELLGRSGRSIKGKEGVGFVLRSLPENARNLYRVLVAELLAGMDKDPAHDPQEQNDINDDNDIVGPRGQGENVADRGGQGFRRSGRGAASAGAVTGIEYRTLYHKVVEDFICTSEMAFRALLQEFHDHRMIVSRRDATGEEMLSVPFRREEMEAILEDLVM